MKVKYDGSGNIQVVTIDSKDIGSVNVITVPDSQDLILHSGKYKVSSGAVVLKPSLVMSLAPTSAKADNTTLITVSFQAKNGSGADDSSAAWTINLNLLQSAGSSAPVITLSSNTVTLVGGVGSVTARASSPTSALLAAGTTSAWGGVPVKLTFTA